MRALPLALSIATFAACAAHARPARADEPEETSPAPASEPAPSPGALQWYGWQILLADLGFVTLYTVATSGGAYSGTALAIAGYFAGGPIIHGVHGKGGRAGGSFALRLGLPVVCGLYALAALNPTDDTLSPGQVQDFQQRQARAARLDILVGMIAASVIDSTALAWTRAPATDEKAASSWVLVPSTTMSRDTAGRQVPTFGVSGAF